MKSESSRENPREAAAPCKGHPDQFLYVEWAGVLPKHATQTTAEARMNVSAGRPIADRHDLQGTGNARGPSAATSYIRKGQHTALRSEGDHGGLDHLPRSRASVLHEQLWDSCIVRSRGLDGWQSCCNRTVSTRTARSTQSEMTPGIPSSVFWSSGWWSTGGPS